MRHSLLPGFDPTASKIHSTDAVFPVRGFRYLCRIWLLQAFGVPESLSSIQVGKCSAPEIGARQACSRT
jgi:hypothetical protein